MWCGAWEVIMKKELLIEDCIALTPPINKEEEADKSSDVWVADIWKLDERNLNGRTYPKALGERIVRENRTTLANDGHEYQVGEYGVAKAVCSNPRIENGYLRVDVQIIDKDYAHKLLMISQAGMKIGVSSCGYGTCDENGVVDVATYELVRYMDFVTRPAGQVYATINKTNPAGTDKKESLDTLSASALARRKKLAVETFKYFTGEKNGFKNA